MFWSDYAIALYLHAYLGNLNENQIQSLVFIKIYIDFFYSISNISNMFIFN